MKCKHCGEELKMMCYETIYYYEETGTSEIVYFCDMHCYYHYDYDNYDPFGEPKGYWTKSKYIKLDSGDSKWAS